MQVACEHCKTKINIPDRKMPKGQRVRLNCPKCKKAFSVVAPRAKRKGPRQSGPAPHDETGKFHLRFIESKPAGGGEEEDYGYDQYTDDKDLDFYEEDARLALIMVDAPRQASKIESAVKGMGYRCISSPNTRDAIGKMRFHDFDLVILADGYDGQDLINNSDALFESSLHVRSKKYFSGSDRRSL